MMLTNQSTVSRRISSHESIGVVTGSISSQSESGVQAGVLHHWRGEGAGGLPLLPGEGLPSHRDVLLVPRRSPYILSVTSPTYIQLDNSILTFAAAVFTSTTQFEMTEGREGEFSCQARNIAGLGNKCNIRVSEKQ